MQALTPDDVQKVLSAYDASLKIIYHETPAATSEQAAQLHGCDVGQIAKSICLMVNGEPLLIVASGDQRIDTKKVAQRLGVGRKKVKMATAEECVAVFGYAPGGVPPVGHRTPDLPIWLDATLQRYPHVYAAAGLPETTFKVTLAQLQGLTQADFVDVVRDDS
jgi:prolyl-tRNA editing enzyme YbaK/EbsC (Cys-tRNA(Pro) deacylase)